MTHEEIFLLMQGFIRSVEGQLLTAYRNDFFVHDKEYLEANWNSESTMVWVVTPNGTHLTEIGLHVRQNEWAIATLQTGYRDQAAFLVDNRGLHAVTKEKALAACKALRYSLSGTLVKNQQGHTIAALTMRPRRVQAAQGGDVEFCLAENVKLSPELRHALNAIAVSEMVRHYGSWFCKVDSVIFSRSSQPETTGLPLKEMLYA